MNILAIGAHPDDIEYGCGGTLLKWANQGENIFIYVATEGEFGKNGNDRKKEQIQASKIIGARQIFWGGYRDTEIPLNQEHISQLEDIITKTQADYVLSGNIHSIDMPGLSYGTFERAVELRVAGKYSYQLKKQNSEEIPLQRKMFTKRESFNVQPTAVLAQDQKRHALQEQADSIAEEIYIHLYHLFTPVKRKK